MTDSKSSETDVQDPLLGISHAIDQVGVKALSYKQLRRLHAALMDVVDKVISEIESRSEDDNAGDTVRVPVPPRK